MTTFVPRIITRHTTANTVHLSGYLIDPDVIERALDGDSTGWDEAVGNVLELAERENQTMQVKKSLQGFEYVEFYDYYNRKAVLTTKQSGKPARDIILFHGQVALDRGAAQRLVDRIQAWIDTGSFELSQSVYPMHVRDIGPGNGPRKV